MYKKATFVSNTKLNQYGKVAATNQPKVTLKCQNSQKSDIQTQAKNASLDRRALILTSMYKY